MSTAVARRGTASGWWARLSPWVGVVARLALGGVFLAAGLFKITDPQGSARAVQAYQLLPYDVGQLVGYGLPFLEVLLATMLLVGFETRLAASACGLLLIVFVIGVASVWARGLSIDCGCFGGGGPVAAGDTRYVQELVRDAALLLAAGWLVVRPRTPWSLDSRLEEKRR